jgi:MraZ protein
MFLGTYQPNLIGKGRIALPKKIRNELAGERMVLTIGFEKCIFGFSEKDWEEIIKPELSRPLFSDSEGRELRRKMCMEAAVVNLDSQGRFIMPEPMMKFACIEERLILIGAGDHFEIWDSTSWKKYLTKIENQAK